MILYEAKEAYDEGFNACKRFISTVTGMEIEDLIAKHTPKPPVASTRTDWDGIVESVERCISCGKIIEWNFDFCPCCGQRQREKYE